MNYDKYRKTRTVCCNIRCSIEERKSIHKLATLQGKKINELIIDMVKEKLNELNK